MKVVYIDMTISKKRMTYRNIGGKKSFNAQTSCDTIIRYWSICWHWRSQKFWLEGAQNRKKFV